MTKKFSRITAYLQWCDFRRKVLPKTMSKRELKQRKIVFYAGIEAMMRINWALGDNEYTEDEGAEALEDILNEIKKFADDMLKST